MASAPVLLSLSGHVTLRAAQGAFDDLASRLPRDDRADVVVDMGAVSSYDEDARRWFGEVWAPVWAGSLRRLAVVESRAEWRMVTASMSLPTGIRMRAFATLAEAEEWLASC